MSRRIAVRAVVLDGDGKLFCVRLKAHANHELGDFWCLPGGGLDDDESLLDGLRREMIEETAVEPGVGNLLYIQQYADADQEYLEFFFHVTNADDYKHKIDLASASHADDEIEEAAFVDPKNTYILPKFLTTEDLVAHVKNNAPTKIFR
jgi:ADP-ribose pyrophosphatase YjhB (NUDIX family)